MRMVQMAAEGSKEVEGKKKKRKTATATLCSGKSGTMCGRHTDGRAGGRGGWQMRVALSNCARALSVQVSEHDDADSECVPSAERLACLHNKAEKIETRLITGRDSPNNNTFNTADLKRWKI